MKLKLVFLLTIIAILTSITLATLSMRKALPPCHSTWLRRIKVIGCFACLAKNYVSMSLLALAKTKVPYVDDKNITSSVIIKLI
jgi:hypothetical protein